jgi:hypothetical protein
MSTRSLAMRHTVLLALLLVTACTAAREGSSDNAGEGIGSANGDDGDGAPDGELDDDDDSDGLSDGGESCVTSLVAAKQVLEDYCVGCHGAQPAGNNFANITDAVGLVASGKVVADDPENSPLYQMISTNMMPPAQVLKRPEQADIDTVRTWIACGAANWTGDGPYTPVFTDLTERMAEVLDDVRSLPTPEERLDVRYLDLYPLTNAGYSEERLEQYRQMLSYVMNSLSQGPEVALLEEVGSKRALLRIRLSAYGWTPQLWEQLAAVYPYATRYDPTSQLFPISDADAESVREETGTSVPVVHADWFLAHATRPPLYHQLLGIPPRLQDLERALGIDIATNIASGAVARAGFRDSGPSRYNRIIERHTLAPERGALWLTYDFSSNAGTSNIFLHPLDFVPSSGELLFHLPNGFPAFMIVDTGGNRLDTASTTTVQDSAAKDLLMENGLSCLSCHVASGFERVADELREASLGADFPAQDLTTIQALYPEQTVLDDLFRADRQRFETASSAARLDRLERGSLHQMDDRHRDNLKLYDMAGVLGITQDELQGAVDTVGAACPPRITALTTVEDSLIPRDAFDALFAELVVCISLGQPVTP